MKKRDLLTSFLNYAEELKIDTNIKNIIVDNLQKHTLVKLTDKKNIKLLHKPTNKNAERTLHKPTNNTQIADGTRKRWKRDKLNVEMDFLVRNSIMYKGKGVGNAKTDYKKNNYKENNNMNEEHNKENLKNKINTNDKNKEDGPKESTKKKNLKRYTFSVKQHKFSDKENDGEKELDKTSSKLSLQKEKLNKNKVSNETKNNRFLSTNNIGADSDINKKNLGTINNQSDVSSHGDKAENNNTQTSIFKYAKKDSKGKFQKKDIDIRDTSNLTNKKGKAGNKRNVVTSSSFEDENNKDTFNEKPLFKSQETKNKRTVQNDVNNKQSTKPPAKLHWKTAKKLAEAAKKDAVLAEKANKISENDKLIKSEGTTKKINPILKTRKSAFVARDAFKASEEVDKKLKVANISKFNTTKMKRRRVCMPKPAKKPETRGRKKKSVMPESVTIAKTEEKKQSVFQPSITTKVDNIVEEKKSEPSKDEINLNLQTESKPSYNTITRENIALKDAFKNLKNAVFNKTLFSASTLPPKKESLDIKKDRSLEDIKKDVETLMPKTTYLFKDEYTPVEKLAPKKSTMFGNEYFKKMQFHSHTKENNPNNYVSQTYVSNLDYNYDFEGYRGETWSNNVDHIIYKQRHNVIEREFRVEGPVDVVSMFPSTKNVCNDSPNKFVKRF